MSNFAKFLIACAAFILGMLMLNITPAHAGHFEGSIGKTYMTHNLAYSIGYDWTMFGIPVRAGYANLGTPSMDMNVSPEDYADDNAAGWGGPPCHWLAPNPIKEVYFTADPVVYQGEYTYSLELGVALYHSQWQQDICQKWYNEAPHNYHNPPNVTPIIGFVVGKGKVSYALIYQDITGRGDWEGDNPQSTTVTFAIRYNF